MHCRDQVVQLHRDLGSIRAAGAELYVIGNGAPMFIEGFRETTGFTGPIYTDPSLAVYQAAQLVRSVARTFGPGALVRSFGALRRGARQGRTQGDPWQQGGALVIAPDGRVLWHQVSNGPGDHASATDLLAALRAA
jgi:hypothetical protein